MLLLVGAGWLSRLPESTSWKASVPGWRIVPAPLRRNRQKSSTYCRPRVYGGRGLDTWELFGTI